MTTNGEWLDYLAQNAPDELAAWFDAERVTNQAEMLHIDASDGDTDALERKSADLIYEYYKPMVAELQAHVDELEAERDNLADDLLIASKQREWYRSKFGKCIDYADAIHALMDDEGIA